MVAPRPQPTKSGKQRIQLIADDLQTFSLEPVVRAVAASRIPTLVAIGHEIDTSLAELAADQRASTPSNAAELLVPDRKAILQNLAATREALMRDITEIFAECREALTGKREQLHDAATRFFKETRDDLRTKQQLLAALDPSLALTRGFAIIRDAEGRIIKTAKTIRPDAIVHVEMSDARFGAKVTEVQSKHGNEKI